MDAFLEINQQFSNSTFVSHHWPSLCARDVAPVCPEGPPAQVKKKIVERIYLKFIVLQSVISFIPLWVVGGVLGAAVGIVLALLVAWRWWRNRQHRSRNEIILELEIN